MDVERRLIIMRRIAGAVGTAVLQILKWMLKIVGVSQSLCKPSN